MINMETEWTGKIRRVIALKEYDVKETPSGRQATFSIRFMKKNGELVFLPKAIACGMPFNMWANRMRGVQAVDDQGKATGHPYPVNIDFIIEWNGKKVIL
jgi:hypothetical protein